MDAAGVGAEASGSVFEAQRQQQSFTLENYSDPQRYVLSAAMQSSGFQTGQQEELQLRQAFARAQTRKVGVGAAAYANLLVQQVNSSRALAPDGIELLEATPYVNPSSAFATSFLRSMTECAPATLAAEVPISAELRSASQAVSYAYMVSFMASARPSDFACAAGRACFGMNLYDEHGRPVAGTVWKVFWTASEIADVHQSPTSYEKEAKTRFCIGCKLKHAVDRIYKIAAHNARMRPNLLACDIHCFVDVPGEFPIATTVGLGSGAYQGLVFNIPRISRVGWTTEPDNQCTGCYRYKWNVPQFPVPPDYYVRKSDDAQAPSF